jgi:hypothetical protein
MLIDRLHLCSSFDILLFFYAWFDAFFSYSNLFTFSRKLAYYPESLLIYSFSFFTIASGLTDWPPRLASSCSSFSWAFSFTNSTFYLAVEMSCSVIGLEQK